MIGASPSTESINASIALLQERGVLGSVSLAGLDDDSAALVLRTVDWFAGRFPVGFRGAPVDLRVDDPPAVGKEIGGFYGPHRGRTSVWINPVLNATGTDLAQTVVHELVHHLYRQLSPAAEDWLWQQLRERTPMRDAIGTSLHPGIVGRITWVFGHGATQNRDEMSAYSTAEALFVPGTRRLSPVGHVHLELFDILYGPNETERSALEEKLGPLRRSSRMPPAVRLSVPGMKVRAQSFLFAKESAPAEAVTFIRTVNQQLFRLCGTQVVDVMASLRTGAIVRSELPSLKGITLNAGSRFRPGPGQQILTISEAVVLSSPGYVAPNPYDVPLPSRLDLSLAEQAFTALIAKEVNAGGGTVSVFQDLVIRELELGAQPTQVNGTAALLRKTTDGEAATAFGDIVRFRGSNHSDANLARALRDLTTHSFTSSDGETHSLVPKYQSLEKSLLSTEDLNRIISDPDQALAAVRQDEQALLPKLGLDLGYS